MKLALLWAVIGAIILQVISSPTSHKSTTSPTKGHSSSKASSLPHKTSVTTHRPSNTSKKVSTTTTKHSTSSKPTSKSSSKSNTSARHSSKPTSTAKSSSKSSLSAKPSSKSTSRSSSRSASSAKLSSSSKKSSKATSSAQTSSKPTSLPVTTTQSHPSVLRTSSSTLTSTQSPSSTAPVPDPPCTPEDPLYFNGGFNHNKDSDFDRYQFEGPTGDLDVEYHVNDVDFRGSIVDTENSNSFELINKGGFGELEFYENVCLTKGEAYQLTYRVGATLIDGNPYPTNCSVRPIVNGQELQDHPTFVCDIYDDAKWSFGECNDDSYSSRTMYYSYPKGGRRFFAERNNNRVSIVFSCGGSSGHAGFVQIDQIAIKPFVQET